jgi:hypothetical protein
MWRNFRSIPSAVEVVASGSTALLVAALALACGSEGDGGVSFQRQIKPLFDTRCINCHFTGNGYADLEDPFNPEHGLVNGESVWFVNHGYGPEFNVQPFEPDQSFVLEKVTNHELSPLVCDGFVDDCLSTRAGLFMPPAPRQLEPAQREAVRQWILDGATQEGYDDAIENIFGNLDGVDGDACAVAGAKFGCIQCTGCHREGGPNVPHSFEPAALIGVKAQFRGDLDLVVPGEPENSFLMMKLDAAEASSDVGSPMPYGYPPLNEAEVAVLRQWISEGAKNN